MTERSGPVTLRSRATRLSSRETVDGSALAMHANRANGVADLRMCECPRCRVLSKVLTHRADPAAPLAPERWLLAHPEEWPWWLLGGIVAVIGLLLLSSVGAVLVLAGAAIAAIPLGRHLLDACERLPS
jgi:hypothetical protein